MSSIIVGAAMIEDSIRKIEEAQQRLKRAQAAVDDVMHRQQTRLQLNREAIDSACETLIPCAREYNAHIGR